MRLKEEGGMGDAGPRRGDEKRGGASREDKAKEREIHRRESKKLGQILVAFAFFSHECGL